MENKINIAELLKDCPKGTKLYSPLCGECEFINIINDVIYVESSLNKTLCFNSLGMYFEWYEESECILFPSKEQRDWSKFQRPFNDGDILVSGLEGYRGNPFIFKQINSFGNTECYCAINCYGKLIFNSDNWTYIKGCRIATEEEKAKLFQAIKDNGYKWNEEIKTLEKLPKFKVGDRVKRKDVDYTYIVTISKLDNDYYDYVNEDGQCGVIHISTLDEWELVPNKFDVINFEPFMKVLVRDNNEQFWTCDWFSFHDTTQVYPFACVGPYVSQCIPFVGNEHLLGTTQDCNEYYKNW